MLLVTILAVSLFAAPTPGFQTVTLKNGMRVVLLPDPQAQAVDVALWYEAGPLFEPKGKSGITHLVERLLVRSGGADTASFHTGLALEGAQASSITTPDYSSIYATGPAETADLVIRRLAAIGRSGPADAAAVAAERDAVLAERSMRLEGSLAARALERLFALAFEGHGYARPVLGIASEVSSITPEDVAAYRAERFMPGTMALSVVGRFDPKPVLAAIKKEFEPLKGPKPAKKNGATRPPSPATPDEERRGTEQGPSGAAAVAVGWRAPAAGDADRAAVEILVRIAGSGPDSRLGRRQSESEWPIGLSRVVFDARRAGSALYAMAVPNPGAELEAAERSLVGTLEQMAAEPITADELRRARLAIERDGMLEQQTVRGRARQLGAALYEEGEMRAKEKWRDALSGVTEADVQRAAVRVLKPALRSVVRLQSTTPDSGGAR